VGGERSGIRVNDMARGMRKSPDSMTMMIGRTVRRRPTDPRVWSELEHPDQAIAANKGGETGQWRNGVNGTFW